MSGTDALKELFDAWARAGRAEGMEKGHAHAARQAFDRLRVAPGQSYLDIGCGNGYTVRWAAGLHPGVRAVGLDVSPAMIARARSLSRGHPNASFLEGDFLTLEIPGGPFDAIFSMEVFYYLPDLGPALERVRDLLKSGGGFACVVDYYGENAASHSWPADLGLPMRLLDADGWADAIRRAGLAVIEQRRLRAHAAEAAAAWKVTEGSLFTLARK